MTGRLDGKVTIGDFTVAAVVDVALAASHRGTAILASGHKRPLAILIYDGVTQDAVSPGGTRLSQQELDDLCPDAWQLFYR